MTHLREIYPPYERVRDMSANGNGGVRLSVFITVVALLASSIAGSYAYTSGRTEAIRLEVKQDLQRVHDSIVGEIRRSDR